MRNFNITVNGKQYQVGVEELGEGVAPKAAPAPAAPAPAPKAAPTPAAPAPAAAPAGGGTKVNAPMPGTILDIKVNVGDAVKEGQPIIILEAMKMENDIVAPCDGTVNVIAVKKGDSVDTNQLVATIG